MGELGREPSQRDVELAQRPVPGFLSQLGQAARQSLLDEVAAPADDAQHPGHESEERVEQRQRQEGQNAKHALERALGMDVERETGAGGGTRTPDPSLTKRLLYQLSYSGGGAQYTDSAPRREAQPLRRTRMTTSTLSISVPGGNSGSRANERSSGRMSIISPVSTFWK